MSDSQTDFNDLHQQGGEQAVRECIDAATTTAQAGTTWLAPTPLPDALPPVQPLDAELLPVVLRGWVMDIAHRMQCPPDFPAVGAIVALSSLIGARAVVQPKAKDDWQVVPNLWGLIVGRPGVMKSPALGESLKPLQRLQAKELELWQAAHNAWALDVKLAELQGADNEKKAKGLATKNPAAARALLEPMEMPEEPQARRFIVNDATVEKLGELLQVNPWGTLSYRDELYGLLTSMDRQGQEGSRAFYLQAYDGNQGYTFDRIMRGTVHIPRVCLAMIGGIQPGRIKEYVRGAVSGGSADDGLLQRFGLTVWPDVAAEFHHIDRWPDTPAKQAAWAIFERLAALQPASDTEPHVWRFSPAAQALFIEWLVPFETEIRGDDLHPAMVSHLSKYRKLIPALALVFALIDTPDSGGMIGATELMRALAWGEYLRTHANRLYAAAVMPETAGAATLLQRIKTGVLNAEFTPRQAALKGWAGLNTPEAVRKAADVLTDYDWLRRDVIQTGGRPSERYLVNPAALARGGGMNWLARLKKMESAPTATLQNLQNSPFVGFVGACPGTFENSEGSAVVPIGTDTDPANDDAADITTARIALFTDRGLSLEDAQAMAERLNQRDQGHDERRLCIECMHLCGGALRWRCAQWQQHQHNSADIPGDLVTAILHRCSLFKARLETSE